MYGLLFEYVEHNLIIINSIPSKIPYSPRIAAHIKNKNRYILIALLKSVLLNAREEIKLRAIVIIIIGLTIPAATAASPSIKAPKIDYKINYWKNFALICIAIIVAIFGLLVVEFNPKIRQAIIDKYVTIELINKGFYKILF